MLKEVGKYNPSGGVIHQVIHEQAEAIHLLLQRSLLVNQLVGNSLSKVCYAKGLKWIDFGKEQ